MVLEGNYLCLTAHVNGYMKGRASEVYCKLILFFQYICFYKENCQAGSIRSFKENKLWNIGSVCLLAYRVTVFA